MTYRRLNAKGEDGEIAAGAILVGFVVGPFRMCPSLASEMMTLFSFQLWGFIYNTIEKYHILSVRGGLVTTRQLCDSEADERGVQRKGASSSL